jgi:hypothetical protein
MARSTSNTPAAAPAATAADFDDAEDLFGGTGVAVEGGDFEDADDLLNTVQEDDAEGWVPTEKGESLAGVVVKVGETRSDFAKPGEDPMVPTVTVLTREGDKYRVIGFGSVLKREIEDANVQVGGLFAVKYWGEKPIKKGPFAGKNYKHYSVAFKPKKG